MGIKPCPWVTVRSLKILETIFVVIEKRSPLDTLFRGKTTYWFKILIFKKEFQHFFSIHLHELPLHAIICHSLRFYMHPNLCTESWFWGKNYQICVYPQNESWWGTFKLRYDPFEHIFMFVRVTEESPHCDIL